VGIVGAGTMGAGIAQVALEAGHPVAIHDPAPGAIDRARATLADGLARRARRRYPAATEATAWVHDRLGDLSVAPDLGALAAGRGLVIEAVVEALDLKRAVFEALDRFAPPDAILATNTSALSVAALAAATGRPSRVCGLHFFSPVPLMRLVEVSSTSATEPWVADELVALMARWGKSPIRCRDVPGFVVNRVNRAFTLESLAVVEAGRASMDGLDAALREAGYPMGPFELMDLIGLDVNLATSRALHEAARSQGDPLADRFRPSPLQERLVRDGRMGRKTGHGFRTHPGGVVETPQGASIDADALHAAEGVTLAIVLEAFRALDERIATEEDIDQALRDGAGHPVGPLERARTMGGRAAIEARVRERGDAGPRFSLGRRVPQH
jgi:3-hydroxybutyryl-CoA dehydrogenase